MAKRGRRTAAAASGDEGPENRPMTRAEARVHLEAIRAKSPDKRLHVQAIIKEVEDSHWTHPLSGFFTRDVDEAARKRWLDEARQLVRWVKVEIIHEAAAPRVPFYVHLHCDRDSGGGYRPVQEVKSSADLLQALKETALADLQGWVRRYQMIKDDIHDIVAHALGVRVMPQIQTADSAPGDEEAA